MLTYDLDQRGNLPRYDYLCRRIRADIRTGTLKADEKLPSKRRLAEHLKLSVITVENAYAQLVAEGYLYTRPKRGYYVSRLERLPMGESVPRGVIPPAPTPPEWKADFASNRIDDTRFPFATWSRLYRQVLSEESNRLLHSVPHQGLPALREAIADDLRNDRGMTVSPEQIVIGAGSEYLYLLLAQLLGTDNVFAVEDPGYPKIRQVYGKCGIACRPVPLDALGMDANALEQSDASVAHLSPSHHYPTGLVMPVARRYELLRWAGTKRYIIEDDYDSELRFAGAPLRPLQSIDDRERVIYMNTFSQTIAPSMRIGYLVLPPHLLERYRRELNFYACPVASTEQYVLAKFLSGGYFEQHLSRMRNEYRARRAGVLEAFRSSPFADRVTITEQGAGLHFLLHLRTKQSDETMKQRAADAGVRLSFLSEFAVEHPERFAHTVVVNYAGLEEKQLQAGIEGFAQILAESRDIKQFNSKN